MKYNDELVYDILIITKLVCDNILMNAGISLHFLIYNFIHKQTSSLKTVRDLAQKQSGQKSKVAQIYVMKGQNGRGTFENWLKTCMLVFPSLLL